jgi:hypothetical protein
MTISLVGTPTTFAGAPNATPAAGTHRGVGPTGTASGDVIWALWVCESHSGNTASLPTGWTTVASINTGTTNFYLAYGYIVRGAGAPSFDFGYGTAVAVTYVELLIWAESGEDPTVIDDAPASPAPVSQATAVDPGAATANFNTDWVHVVSVDWAGGPTGGWGAPTTPVAYTLIANAGTGGASAAARLAVSSTGAQDPGPFVGATAADYKWTHTATVKAAGAATPGGAGASSAGSSSTATGGSPPQNTVAPVASGTAQAGQTVSATQGTWNHSPTGYTYQWQRRLP